MGYNLIKNIAPYFKQLKFVNGMDKFPPKIRSEIMKRVKSNNNSPEIAI
ncbi:TPA: very short patch repair endonuclease, partial [Legionella pneumophila subsp. pneumophila]|nr:very short patch repair endonuclease [Legionella pneumophila subsp. pneumophila]